MPPCNLYAAEDGAREVVEQLIRDAGYHPVSAAGSRKGAQARVLASRLWCAGGLENARMLEDHLGLMNAINNGGLGRFFYRYAAPGEL